VLTSRGLVLFLSGRLPQALQHAQSALRGDPGHEPAQRLRKRVKDVERLKEEGNAAFKTGKLDDAIEKYGEALDVRGLQLFFHLHSHPLTPCAARRRRRGGGQRRPDPRDAAVEPRHGAAQGMPRLRRHSHPNANDDPQLNRHEDALRDTDASLELTPTSFKALRTRARIHLHLEHYDQCVADFKAAIQQVGMDGSAGEADLRALKTELKKAEAALKRSKTKDYYKILGVQRDCTEQDIRKGYRRESLKHHPDKVRCSFCIFKLELDSHLSAHRAATRKSSSLS
jgi:DnaJ family protein C protein 7